MKNKHVQGTSDILLAIANKNFKEKITFQEILEAFGEQAFGFLLLFFSLPSALPFSAIPGISAIFSIPILIFAVQMIIGRKSLWLPKFLANRTIQKKTMVKLIYAAQPYLKKVEYLLKPRWPFMTSHFMEIINGLVIFCLALLLTFPIPLSNFVFALLLIIFSLGLIEKDGVLLVIGHIAAIIYMSFMYLVIVSAIKLVFKWF